MLANRELAELYLTQGRAHLGAAALIEASDVAGAFSLAYDAARLALAAILVNQGLRPSGEGAHAVLLEAVLAQLEPPRQAEFRQFSWMRRLRNDTQYPEADKPVAGSEDVARAILAAEAAGSSGRPLPPGAPAALAWVSQRRVSGIEVGDVEQARAPTLRRYAEAADSQLRVEVQTGDRFRVT
ncbi:MAG: HEPN domain-containing protein [Bifidobacteriaceae bacterium]|nr:HEPN domain-containing protein [Bifidobacteriaceae bacterium]